MTLGLITRAARSLEWRRLRRKFFGALRPSDVFIVGYPKSGSTWLRHMVAELVKPDPAEELDIKTISRYVPDLNEEWPTGFEALPDPRFFSSHSRYEPRLPRVVYVVRDPRDVVVSYWHYQRMMAPGFEKPIEEFAVDETVWPGTWERHASGWLIEGRHPDLMTLKYEDLLRDTPGELARVLRFAKLDRDAGAIARAVEESRFEKMRAREEKTRRENKGPAAKEERFVRKGKSGGWREELPPAALKALESRFAATMRHFGYATETV